jgi:hypothetical protein
MTDLLVGVLLGALLVLAILGAVRVVLQHERELSDLRTVLSETSSQANGIGSSQITHATRLQAVEDQLHALDRDCERLANSAGVARYGKG